MPATPDDTPTLAPPGGGAPGPGPGARLGPYEVLSELGEGGFGIVYLARQHAPVQRRVALKVIKPGMDSRAVLARFEAERQALAVMTHPCIARVFDAGATPEGRPYFAMELVQGEPITDFAHRHRLTVEERLAIMLDVCEAVQHAHAKGVVHRDLKPSNILVAYEGSRAAPKVIDFGVAKALHRPLTDRTLMTEQGQLVGTPEYMSPEQAEMSGLDVDTRADVYSLGVVLYELLTGTLPLGSEQLRTGGYADTQRIIREVEPPRPSTRLASLARTPAQAEGAPRVGADRRLDLPALGRVLRRDLDWVVMRCLEKNRERRYETPAALGEELRRVLDGQPVLAGPPGAGCRASKFVRRHRVKLGFAAAAAAVLIAATAVSTAFAVGQARERARAEEAVTFLKQVIGSIDPELARSSDTTVIRAALDVASGRIETALTRDPLLEAEMRETVAAAYESIGAYDLALAHRQAALARLSTLRRADPRLVVDATEQVGVTLLLLERLDDARPHLERAEERYVALLGPDHEVTLRARDNLASLEESLGLTDRAEARYRAVLDARRRTLGQHHEMTLITLNNLAYLVAGTDRLDEAAALYNEALAGFTHLMGPDSPTTLMVLDNAIGVLTQGGHFDEADRQTAALIERLSRVVDPDHPQLLSALNNAGMLHARMGRLDTAEAEFRQALPGLERRLGPEHPRTASTRHNLGSVLRRLGRPAEAADQLTLALAARRTALGDDHEQTLDSLFVLAESLIDAGRPGEAAPLAAEYRQRAARVFGDGSSQAAAGDDLLARANAAVAPAG